MNRVTFFYSFLLLSLGFLACNEQKIEHKTSGAFEALQLSSQSRAYPAGDIPEYAYRQALKEHQLIRSKTVNRGAVDPWETMGPHNTAGRTLALAINPQADSTIYLGSASGGLWRSRSLGLGVSWEYVATMPGVLGVSAIAFAPGDSTEMYIGTGEVYNNETTGDGAAYRATRGSYGVGILKSTDGGATWTSSLDVSYNDRFGVQSVQVSRSNANIVYAATTKGVFRSVDSGNSWTNVLSLNMCTDVEIHQSNPDIAVAAFGNLGSADKGLYRTEDGGENWQLLSPPGFPSNFQGKIELTSSSSNPDVFYASIGNGFSSATGATWLFRSANAGANWVLMNQTDYSIYQGWFAHDVAVSPDDEDRLIAVGINVWNSSDGGANLVQSSNGGGFGLVLGQPPIEGPDGPIDYSHLDHHVALFHPNIEDLAFVGNDGGLFHVTNNGTNFRSANGGLQTTQFYCGFAISHQDPNFAMGGLQDNSSVIYRGSRAWTRVIGGDGSYAGISYDNDQFVFGSAQNLYVVKSEDGGQTFTGQNIPQGGDFAAFIAPYAIAQSDPEVMYAGTQYLYKTTDRGELWFRANGGNAVNGDPIFKIGISPSDRNTLMVGTAPFGERSSLFISFDGAVSFEPIKMNNLPDRYVNDIVFDPTVEGRIYITFNGFGTGHLFVTNDFGQTWTDLSTDLPDVPGNAVAIDPALPDHVYYGTDLGVYVSTDAGTTWEDFQEGITGSFLVSDLMLSPVDGKIWLSTHGRGAFRRDMLPETSSVAGEQALIEDIQMLVSPNPASGSHVTLETNSKQSYAVKATLVSATGQLNRTLEHIDKLTIGKQRFDIDTKDLNAGTYFIILSDGKKSISTQFVYQ